MNSDLPIQKFYLSDMIINPAIISITKRGPSKCGIKKDIIIPSCPCNSFGPENFEYFNRLQKDY